MNTQKVRQAAEERLSGQIFHSRQILPALQLRLVLQPFQQWPRPRPDTEISFMFEYFQCIILDAECM